MTSLSKAYFFIVAGDISGDFHAANLVAALKKLSPDTRVRAIGGARLKNAADDFSFDIVSYGAFGFTAAATNYFRLKAIFRDHIVRAWDARRPDKVILVDYYGFNIFVAEEAHRRGIPVFYYISPQVWASRPGRIKKLARFVRKMLVILPFEEKLYREAGVDAHFVGHPLLDHVPDVDGEDRTPAPPFTVGLFPGSRLNVLKRHVPVLIDAARRIRAKVSANFVLYTLPQHVPQLSGLPFEVVSETDYEQRRKLALAITTSGTVSLENALLGIPMVVMYRLSSFNYFLARQLVRVPYITMVNILADREIVPELIQDKATPEGIAREAVSLLTDPSKRSEIRQELLQFRKELGKPGVSERAARILLE